MSIVIPDSLLSNIDYATPVRIGWLVDSPLVTECFEDKGIQCQLPGYEVEYIYTIIHGILKLDVEFVQYKSYEDMQLGLSNLEFDVPALSLFLDRKWAIENGWGWAPIYLWDGTALIAKEFDEPSNDTLLLLEAFSIDLWVSLIAITLGTVALRWMSKRLYKTRLRAGLPYHCISSVAYVFRAKIFYVLWFLLLGILLNFYGNVFAVNLLTSTKNKVVAFTDFNDLGRKLLNGQCRLAIYEKYIGDSEFHGTIINPSPERNNKTWAPLFREAYAMNRTLYASSREEMMNRVLNDPCTVGLDWLTMEPFFTSHYCNVRVIMYSDERETFYQYTFYTLRMDIRDAVYSVISHEAFQSFPNHLAKKYYMKNSPRDCKAVESAVEPLTLLKLQDSLYVWILGMAISLMVLVYEKVKIEHPHWIGISKRRKVKTLASVVTKVQTITVEDEILVAKTNVGTQTIGQPLLFRQVTRKSKPQK